MKRVQPLLLLRPIFLEIRNRWRGRVDVRAHAGRDVFLLLFSLLLMVAVFVFTQWALVEANKNPTLAVLPPSMLLGLIFAMLLVMLLISSVLTALGTFYLSNDLELILPSPIPWRKVFFGKYVYVFLFSSWMPFLFASPMLLAFGVTGNASGSYYLGAPILMLPYFAIATSFGVVVATLLVLFVPVYRVRETILVLAGAGLVAAYFVLDSLAIEWDSLRSAQEIMRVMTLITAPSVSWLPSNWVASSMGELLRPAEQPLVWYATALFTVSIASIALAFLTTFALHASAYSSITRKRGETVQGSRLGRAVLRFVGSRMPPAFRALLGKELRVLFRDIGQVVQIFMLVALSLIYLYYMRLFSAVDAFPEAIRPWWKNFLFVGNITMGAFVITALCTRFVVPSISLEGRSLWIVQTSPIPLRELVRMKFLAWLIPTSVVAAIFFVTGAVAIGADPLIVVLCAFSSLAISYGVVGLAMGFGAYFAYFDWEHASQLAGSVGSLLFMLVATALIFINMVPAWIVLTYGPRIDFSFDGMILLAYLVVLVITVLGVNIQAGSVAMRGGVRSLAKRIG